MDDMNEILSTIEYFFKNRIIDENEYEEYKRLALGSENDIKNLERKLVDKYRGYTTSKRVVSSINDSDFNFDVNDGELSDYTGVIPLSDVISKVEEMKKSDINNSIIRDNLNEYEEIGEGESLGIQKTIGAHPLTGKFFSSAEENGFMTFLFVIFLAGISSGIIFMIILNFLAR